MSEGRRLHSAAILVGIVDQLRGLLLPIIVVSLLGGRGGDAFGRALLYTLAGVVFFSIWQGLYFATARWFVDDESVRLRTGVLSESVVAVPLDRIQAVDTQHGPIQRLFGVVEVRIQTAGGGRGAEIVLKAVTEADADEIRAAVRRGGGKARIADDETPQADALVWTIDTPTLVKAAATSGSLGVLVPFVAAATQFGNDLLSTKEAERLLPHSSLEAARDVAVVIAAAWLLSFLGTVVAFAGFRLTRDPARLRIQRGFFIRRDASVPVARVHAVRIVEGPLREPFGLAQIRIDTAGYAHEAASAQTLIPLVRRVDVAAVIERYLPEFAGPIDGLERLPRRAARRYALPLTLPWVVVAVVVAVIVGVVGLLVALVAVLGALLGVLRWRAAGYRVDGDRVVTRGRRYARTTAVAHAARFQHVDMSANPFQRRARLATLVLALGSGRHVGVRHMAEDVAARLFDALGAIAIEGRSSA